jgi:hypothetical protein
MKMEGGIGFGVIYVYHILFWNYSLEGSIIGWVGVYHRFGILTFGLPYGE